MVFVNKFGVVTECFRADLEGITTKQVAFPDVDGYERKKGSAYPSALGWYNH